MINELCKVSEIKDIWIYGYNFEKAEEFISNIGDELDPNKEQEDEECEAEGVREHPILDIKDPTGIMDEEPSLSLKHFLSHWHACTFGAKGF